MILYDSLHVTVPHGLCHVFIILNLYDFKHMFNPWIEEQLADDVTYTWPKGGTFTSTTASLHVYTFPASLAIHAGIYYDDVHGG